MTFLSVMGLLFLILIVSTILYGIGQLWDWIRDMVEFKRRNEEKMADLRHKYEQLNYKLDKLEDQVAGLDYKMKTYLPTG